LKDERGLRTQRQWVRGEVGQSANELANLHAAININEQLNASAVVALSSRIYQPVRSFPHLDFINRAASGKYYIFAY